MIEKKVELRLQKGDDGYWLVFENGKGGSAAININNVFPDDNRIVHKAIKQWAIDQFPEEEKEKECPICESPLENNGAGSYVCSDVGNNNCGYIESDYDNG